MIFGTTQFGGNQRCQSAGGTGCGTVFELVPPEKSGSAWSEKLLHVFTDGADGVGPNPLVFGIDGGIYGTAGGGGSHRSSGVIFRLDSVDKR
jgi:hypothetical protein